MWFEGGLNRIKGGVRENVFFVWLIGFSSEESIVSVWKEFIVY